VILDQGAVGHPTRKPTTLLSDIPEVAQLHGLKDDRPPQHNRQKLSLEQRLEQSKSWAAWAEGLKYVLKVAAKRIKNTPTAAMKVVNLPKKEVESWRRHFAAGHVPYRRDCGVCVEAAGRGRCRKRIQHPEAFCLSVDTAGPFCAGVDQSRKKAKYMLIGTITIPTKKGRPMVEGLDRLIARDPGKDQHLDSMEEALMSLYDQYKEMENPEEDPLKIEDEKDSKEKGEDPVEVEAQEVEECVSKEVERAVIEEIKDWSMESLTVAIPLASRNKKEVVEGLTWIYSKLKSIHIPVQRLHADRAREFVSQDVKRWAQARNLHQTFTEGDSGEANGRAEREVGIVKALTRAQLLATGEDKSLWPLALRHGAELRFRQQLLRLGVPTPALIPFGTMGLAERKRWERGEKGEAGLLAPMRRGKIMGPASSMSLTSKGYYVRLEDTGNYIYSTAVVVHKPKSADAFEQVRAEVQDQQQGACPELDAIEAELFPPQLPQQALKASPQYQPDAAQVQQHLDALHHEDDGYSPTEMAESEYDPFTEQFMAEFGEVYERLYPENAPAEERRRRLRGKQTVPARLQVLNLAGGSAEEVVQEEEVMKKVLNAKDVAFFSIITVHHKLNNKEPSANALSAMRFKRLRTQSLRLRRVRMRKQSGGR
jgi:hypothetical protein